MRHGEKSLAEAHACWDGLLARYPWPTSTAFSVMYCESKGDPWAYNPSFGATGLMQILHGPTDPAANVTLAFRMWTERSWSPWVCA